MAERRLIVEAVSVDDRIEERQIVAAAHAQLYLDALAGESTRTGS